MCFPLQNTKYKIQNTGLKGFTLIEALVFLFLFSVVSATFLQTYSISVRTIIESKNRLGASALANQKMEIVRSIAYDAIGTTTGIPAGSLLEDESISVNTTRYNVHTYVRYADDAFDGELGGSPNDIVPNDYKQVRLTVTWGYGGPDQTMSLFGNFSPNGIETPAGGGILSINVLSAAGTGVSGASVHVVNTAESVNFTTSADAMGNITSVGAPAGSQNYELTVSKTGYYGAQTYAPTATFTPVDIHASVVDMALNQASIVMDQHADIRLSSEDPFGTAIPDVDLTVKGGRYLGTDTALSPPEVYSFSQVTSTDGSGEETFADQSYGLYTVNGIAETGYTFYKLSPDGAAPDEFDVVPGVDKDVDVLLASDTLTSLWVTVTNQADTMPISGATVHVTENISRYDATVTTDAFGYAYFPTALPALVAGSYSVEVSATDFQTNTSTVVISDGARVDEPVVLIPN